MLASIVTAGVEDFFGIIIFLVVISRIVGAVKKASSGAGAGKKPAGGERKMQTDLEKFFENLANPDGSAVKEILPPPPPVPTTAKPAKARPVAKAVKHAAPVRRVAPARPIAAALPAMAPIKPAWGTEDYGVDASVPDRATCTETATDARKALVAMLKNEDEIRKAILLREVLGPPVSLRT